MLRRAPRPTHRPPGARDVHGVHGVHAVLVTLVALVVGAGLVATSPARGASAPAPAPAAAPGEVAPAAAGEVVVVDAVDDATSNRWVGEESGTSTVTITAGDTVEWQFDQATMGHDLSSLDTETPWDPSLREYRDPNGAPLQYTFTEPGVYHYVCTLHSTTMTGTVIVEEADEENRPPTADPYVDPRTGPAPLYTHFEANATDPDGDPLTYLWDFGTADDVSDQSTSDHAHVTYPQGRYTVSLTVSDGRGGTYEESWPISATGDAPLVNASADRTSGPAPLPVIFVGSAVDDQGGDLTYAWDFGVPGTDDDISDRARDSYTYPSDGTYTATLTVTDAEGHAGSDSVVVVVGDDAPGSSLSIDATATPSGGAAPLAVQFSTEVTTAGTFTPFADGVASYADLTGSAELVRRGGATSTMIDVTGLKPEAAHMVHVHEQACGDGNAGAHFRFDDTQPFSEANEIWLPFTSDATGASGVVEVTDAQRAGPKAVAIVIHDPDNPALRIGCVDLAPSTAGLTYDWSFGDGETGEGADPTHTYTEAGTYTATVTVSGGEEPVTADVEVVVEGDESEGMTVTASATPTTGPAPLPVQFSTTVSNPMETGGDFAPFADGVVSYPGLEGTATMHRMPGSTMTSIELTGLKPDAAHMVHVHEQACGNANAGAHFRFDDTLPFGEANEIWLPFTSDATGASGVVEVTDAQRAGPKAVAIVIHDPDNPALRIGCVDLAPSDLTYDWSFGDGETGEGADPTHTYTEAGTYTATVTVAGHHGESATADVEVVVEGGEPADTQAPQTTLSGGPTGTVRGAPATFRLASSEPGSTFACRLDAGAFRPCASPVRFAGLRDGAHVLRVRATDAAGNVDSSPVTRRWTVDTRGPKISAAGPRGATGDRTPTLRATLRDQTSSVARGDLSVLVDGRSVAPVRYVARTGRLTWTSSRPMAGGRHTVRVVASDAAGNRSVATWSFTIRR